MTALELIINPITSTSTKQLPIITKNQTISSLITTLHPLQPASSLATPPNSPHVLLSVSSTNNLQTMSLAESNSNYDDSTILQENSVQTEEALSQENIERLKAKISKNNDLLRENLKSSYKRLRLIQTKCFQTHVAQQLNSILELKEKQKLEATTTTNVVPNKPVECIVVAPAVVEVASCCDVIDDTSVDLLTSILKSNLSELAGEVRDGSNYPTLDEAQRPRPNDPVDTTVKSLLDDIQYEILKQQDDTKTIPNKDNINTNSDTDEDHTDIDEDETTHQTHLTTSDEYSLDWTKPTLNDDKQTTLTDSSNLFWTKNRTQLGSEWTRVQTKMKQLKFKFKQCNEYLDKQNSLENYDKHAITRTKSESSVLAVPIEASADKEAIAALSTSLQESVAAEVFATLEEHKPEMECPTVSRCLPYTRSKTSRLFNLNRTDLTELDDDVLKSFYYTLRYFGNMYFKTMCLCGSVEKPMGVKKNNYYYQKKQRLLEQGYSASETLALKKTCIFCHLLKKYEQTRMDNSVGLNVLNKSRQRKQSDVERKKFLLQQTDALKEQQQAVQKNHLKNTSVNFISSDDNTLADPNLVDRDHSYCKQASVFFKDSQDIDSLNDCSNKRTRIGKLETCANEELLDKLIGDRLSRIFDGPIKKETFDIASSNSIDPEFDMDPDELIDAGLDLTPDDLQKLPDLSYEELKFFNEIEMDKTGAYRKKFRFVEDSIDMSCENNGYNRDYTSFMANKAYPLSYQITSEIFHALNYRPKYRSLLNKKRREQKLSDQLQFSEFSRMSEEKKNEGDRKQQQDRINDNNRGRRNSHLSNLEKKNSLIENNHKAPSSPGGLRPRKRQRSTSSYSSNSSILSSSNNDSNYGETTMSPHSHSQKSSSSSSGSASYYNQYYCPGAQNNKFDIDNIIMPFDMISSCIKPDFKQVNVPTPMWRDNQVETLIKDIADEMEECLDDGYFVELHRMCEKRKLDVSRSKKLKLKNCELSASMPASILSECLNKKGSSEFEEEACHKLNSSLNLAKYQLPASITSNNKWQPRQFPLSDQDYEILANQDSQQQQQPVIPKTDDVYVTNSEEIINK